MLAVVVQIDGWDPGAGAAVTLRAASRDDPGVCHLDGETWWPAIERLPTLRYDFFDGDFGGRIGAPPASIGLATEPWPGFGGYALADARTRLWTGEAGAAWGAYTLRFDGRVTTQPRAQDGRAQVEIAVDDRWLDQALLPTYAGTTGAEGPAELKGRAKPLALGTPRYVAGELVDAVASTFQVSAFAVQGIDVALERLARFGAAKADYPTYAALDAATLKGGEWATAKAAGMARLGASPVGQISFLVRGDSAGTDGWARLPGELIRRAALLSGGAGKVDDAGLDALDAARPYPLSVQVEQQTTARDLAQRLAASVNAVAGVSWTGKLFALPVGIGTPQVALHADGSAMPPVVAVEQLDAQAPWRSLAMKAERTWTVHPLGEIAFTATLTDRGDYDAATTYREGDIVQQGGSSWLYVNPAPTAGNAPSAPPADDNAWWKVLAKAGEGGQDGDDGAPALALELGASSITVAATAAGVTKAGELPRTASVRVTEGAVDITADCDVDLTVSSDGIAASYSAGLITITTASSPGYIEVTATRGATLIGTKRIQLLRQLDQPTPQSAASVSRGVTVSISSSSYPVSPIAISTIGADADGAIQAYASVTYYAEGGTGTRTARLSGKMAYRPAGGGSWSDMDVEATGTLATSYSGTEPADPTPGTLSVEQSVGGLTPGSDYEVGFTARKSAGTATQAVGSGGMTVSQ